MKIKQIIVFSLLVLLANSAKNYAQQDRLAEAKGRISKINVIIKEKGYQWKAGLTSISLLSKEEFKRRCGIIADTTFDPVKQKEYGNKLYQKWKNQQRKDLGKITKSIDWKGWMSDIENQGECGNCWAHASTGVTEGLLHYLYGQNIDIDLDEMEITDNATCANGCDGCEYGYENCGLSYIKDNEVRSENHEHFPNRSNTYYSIESYSSQSESINAIITALNSSPVWATMSVYEDFRDLLSNPNYIYEYTYGNYLGDHAIVIVGYGNKNGTDYWVCKNSWGDAWGNGGYFKIKMGECGIDSYGDFVTGTISLNSFASFVPQFYNSVDDAIQISKYNENVYIGTGVFTENIYMKSDVDIYGAGENSTTIDGKVYFNNDNNVIFSDVEINDKITINNSDGVTINSIKAGHSNCYIDVTGGSFLFMSNINSAVSQTQGVYVHSGSDISIWYGSVNNKMDGIHLQDNSYGQISNVDFCTNSCYDIIAYNSSADAYGCTFSSSQPGGSVLGDVDWNFWNSCGGGGGGFEMQASSSLVSDLENNSVTRTHYPASQDYKNIIKGYNSFIDKLKQDIQLTRKFNPQNYASALNSLTERFKKFVMNHPDNRYAIAGLYRIAALLRIQTKYDALSSYMHKILADPALKHLRPYALQNLIPNKIKNQEYKKALKLYNQLIEQYPDHQLVIEWKYGKGMLLKYYMDDHAAAEEVFSEIVSNYPDHPTARPCRDELQNSSDRDLAKKNEEESQELQYLGYNYPNPFNPATNIRFTLPETKKVKIDIYSITGQKIKTLVNNTMKSGYHKITWDATDENGIKVSSGVYIYQLKYGNEVFTKKMIFAK